MHGPSAADPGNSTDNSAKLILESILNFGILCTPERLHFYPDSETRNLRKKALLSKGKPEYSHPQCRFCLTLCTENELFEPKIRGIVPAADGPVVRGDKWLSHSDLFGPYAVSFDPLISRRLGIVPTNYYSPNDLFGDRYSAGAGEGPGLNIQMMHRLKELRELLILLAMLECSITVDGFTLPGVDILRALNLTLPFEDDIVRKITRLTQCEREKIFELFDIDREMALNLVSFVEMMLSLYQETDSTINGEALAFYQQREWRLIHHMRAGMIWYCVGHQPNFRNPLAAQRRREISLLRENINTISGTCRDGTYFDHCWLLEAVDGARICEYISSIIVPARALRQTQELARSVECRADVIAAEEFGFNSQEAPLVSQ